METMKKVSMSMVDSYQHLILHDDGRWGRMKGSHAGYNMFCWWNTINVDPSILAGGMYFRPRVVFSVFLARTPRACPEEES
jgi:hypothetical protein